MFCEGLKNENSPLVSIYGALAGLQELGQEVVKIFVVPNIKAISTRFVLYVYTLRSNVIGCNATNDCILISLLHKSFKYF